MSDVAEGPGWWQASDGKWYPPQPPEPAQPPPGYQAYSATGPGNTGPLGKRENIGLQLLWAILTLGLYGIYWAYKCHEEVKQHSNDGVGGVVGALIYVFAGVVTLFLLPIEIKRMYEREGRQSPVGAATAFWILLFGIPWYWKCQAALNDFWEAKGAPPP